MRKTQLFRRDADRARLVDRLIERWIYERAAITLYRVARERLHGLVDDHRLARFAGEEQEHPDMPEAPPSELGIAPREQPAYGSATIAASEAGTLVELCRADGLEPRHYVQILLSAERLDVAG